MLKEFENVKQHQDGFRRLFSDDYFDLFVWYNDKNQEPIGFQLCYNKKEDEHSLTWKYKKGYLHSSVDTGESSATANRSPILVADGYFDYKFIAKRFINNSENIDRDIAELVHDRLLGYDKRKENPFQ